jgi:hypothetical protein
VRAAQARCREPFLTLTGALVACWQDLADRLAAHGYPVQVISIGQQFGARDAGPEMAAEAGDRLPRPAAEAARLRGKA